MDQFKQYNTEIIEKDLQYLQYFLLNSNETVLETYQLSFDGCITDFGYFQAKGKLKQGFPNGKWRYYRANGLLLQEGYYYKGRKWGVWYRYHNNGHVGSIAIYWDDREIRRVDYDSQGEIYCFNEECAMFYEHPYFIIPF